MPNQEIQIRETGSDDLENTLALWNDGDVMKFVGFPNGLGETMDGMIRWLLWIEKGRPGRNHYSIYAEEIGYCGESFYDIDSDHDNMASLDIKLFSKARGKGIAKKALSHAITEAFRNGACVVWVDPNPANSNAIALYEKLGFQRKEVPDHLKATELANVDFAPVYMQLDQDAWEA